MLAGVLVVLQLTRPFTRSSSPALLRSTQWLTGKLRTAGGFWSVDVCAVVRACCCCVKSRILLFYCVRLRSAEYAFVVQSYLLIRPPGTEGLMFYPRYFFILRHEISELPRPIAVKLCHMIAMRVFFIMQVQKFGRPPPKKNWGPKNAKFGTISDNFRLRSRISPERVKISKIGKTCITSDSFRVQRKKSHELWSSNYRELCEFEPTQIAFSGDYISALRGCCPSNFNTHYRLTSLGSAHPNGDEVPPPQKKLRANM